MNVLALFVVAMNPAAVAVAMPRAALSTARARAATIATAVVVAVLAACSEPLLDWLDVSAPTFQVAAGVVLAIAAARWVAVGAEPPEPGEDPRVLTTLLSPQLVAVAITAGTDLGAGTVIAAAVVALLASGAAVYWQDRWTTTGWSWAARLIGLAGLALALALVVDGVKTV